MNKFFVFAFRTILALFLTLSYGNTLYAETVYKVSITKSSKKRVVLAFSPAYGSPKDLLAQMEETIRFDLETSGLVSLMELPSIRSVHENETFQETNFDAWQKIGPEFILKLNVSKELGTPKIHYSILECFSRKTFKTASQTASSKRVNELAHRIADDILYSLTGKKGLGETRIAFVSDKRGTKTIYSCDIQGNNIEQLVFDPSIVISPDWGPNRESLVYTSYRTIHPTIFIKNFSTNKFESVAAFPGLNANPKINQKYEVVFTASKDGNPELYMKNILSGKVKRLTRRYGVDANPCWSPDGKKIAFVSSLNGSAQIYIMDSNGKNIEQITRGSSYNTSPAFSYDGNLLAFNTMIHGKMNLAIYDFRQRTSEILISHMNNAESPCWAPDSYHIVFCSDKGKQWNLYMVDVETNKTFQITRNFGNCTNPSWK